MTTHIQRAWRRGGITLALGLALGVLSGCDLSVDLPAQLTEDALNDPAGAEVLINSIIHHFADMSESLWFNTQLRTKLEDEWTQAQVPDRNEFLAITSIYEGAVLSVFGQSMCEVTLDGGELQGPAAILTQADAALTRAL